MMRTRTRAVGVLALGTAAALAVSGCSPAAERPSPSPSVTESPRMVLTFGYWSTLGLEEDSAGPSLESQFEDTYPGIDLELHSGDFAEHHDALSQALKDGSGAYDVVAIDEDYIAEFVAKSDGFVNLLELGAGEYKDRYLRWKWDQASSADGSVLIGLGGDVAGLAACYRKDLFDLAGIPSDRAAVSTALGASWADFIAVGEAYVAATGRPFIDNATSILNPAINQLGTGHAYYTRDNALDMANVKPAFDYALAISAAGLSANIDTWTPQWNTGFVNGDFAVVACPSWMLGYIEGQIPADTFEGQWDIADIPGPGGNWGGSFYAIPKQGTEAEQQAAYTFIEWLSHPERQRKAMVETWNLPSQTAILDNRGLATFTQPFFNDAPQGSIFAASVLEIPNVIYRGPKDAAVAAAVEGVLNRVQLGQIAPADAWAAAVAAAVEADAL